MILNHSIHVSYLCKNDIPMYYVAIGKKEIESMQVLSTLNRFIILYLFDLFFYNY